MFFSSIRDFRKFVSNAFQWADHLCNWFFERIYISVSSLCATYTMTYIREYSLKSTDILFGSKIRFELGTRTKFTFRELFYSEMIFAKQNRFRENLEKAKGTTLGSFPQRSSSWSGETVSNESLPSSYRWMNEDDEDDDHGNGPVTVGYYRSRLPVGCLAVGIVAERRTLLLLPSYTKSLDLLVCLFTRRRVYPLFPLLCPLPTVPCHRSLATRNERPCFLSARCATAPRHP